MSPLDVVARPEARRPFLPPVRVAASWLPEYIQLAEAVPARIPNQ